MAWQTELTTLLRSYISDINSTRYKYQDSELQNFIILSGLLVQFDVSLKRTYIFDIDNQIISPDPTDRSTDTSRDDDLISLLLARAGMIILVTEVRNYGSQGIKIQDGKSLFDLKRDLRSLNELAKIFLDHYNLIKLQYMLGKSAYGRAIIKVTSSYTDNLVNRSDGYWFSNLPRTCGRE